MEYPYSDHSGGIVGQDGLPADRTAQALTVASMYVGYAYFMVLRGAPAAVSTVIQTETGLTESDWGKILAMSTVGAVVGKFVGGFAADRCGGRVTFAAGLAGCSLGIAGFGLSGSLLWFQITFALALLAKSSGWPGMTRIVGASFLPAEYGRVWGVLSTSSRVGTILSTLGLGALIAIFSWRGVLMSVAAIGVVVAIGFFLLARVASQRLSAPGKHSSGPIQDPSVPADHPLMGLPLSAAVLRFFMSRQFWLITISLTGMTIMWDFLYVLPLFLKKTLQMSDAGATMAASAYPWGSLVSVLAGGFLFDAISRRRMAWLMAGLLLIATACVFAFWQMQNTPPADNLRVPAAVGLLFIYGIAIAPCYYIPMSVFSIRFGGPHAGFLVSLLDAIAFFINAGFQWVGGELAEKSWSNYLMLLGTVSLTAAVTMLLFMLGEAREEESALRSSKDVS